MEDFSAECVTNIGYDLRAEQFIVNGQAAASAVLEPGESVFVGSREKIKLPDDMIGQVVLKNSRLRQGFSMDAPVYQPGHHTRVFFRLTNVSGDELQLSAGQQYTNILFERLSTPPDRPYSGTFTNEFDFNGLGRNEQRPGFSGMRIRALYLQSIFDRSGSPALPVPQRKSASRRGFPDTPRGPCR